MGGYGIVGGNLPIAAGLGARLATTRSTDDVDALPVRRRRLQPGHVRRDAQPRRAVEAAGRLHGHEQPVRHGHRARAPLGASPTCTSAARASACPGMRCDGMDVVDTHDVTTEALRRAREDRQPVLVEAITYRFRGHSMADPEEYRTKEQVEEWRERDPLKTFAARLVDEGVLAEDDVEEIDEEAVSSVDEAVAFADASPHPGARVALRRRLRARRPGPRLVLGRRARGRRPPRRARARRAPGRRAPRAVRGGRRDARRGRRTGRRAQDDDRGGAARAPEAAATKTMRYREALNEALREEMHRDERVFLMGEDIGVFNGAFKVTAGPARGVRREARPRHADLREHDRRRWASARR